MADSTPRQPSPYLKYMKYVMLLVSTAIGLLLGEFVFRQIPSVSQELLGSLFADDPNYVFRIRPGLEATHKFKQANIDVAYNANSLGYRGPEFAPEPAPGVQRILCVGDSITFGMGVNDHEVYARRLQEQMDQKAGPGKYEVINAGQPGWGTGQQLAWLELEGLKLKPAGIVLQFLSTNDFYDDRRYGIYSLKEGKLVRNTLSRQRISTARKITEWIPFYQFLTEHSILFNYFRRWVLVRLQWKDENRDQTASPEANQDKDKVIKDSAELNQALFKAFRDTAAENKIPLLVLLTIDPKNLHGWNDKETPEVVKIHKAARKNVETLKIPFVDLVDDFPKLAAQNKEDVDTYFLPQDHHFTPLGNGKVAEILQKRISAGWK